MEYFRTVNGQIQASLAYRLGIVLKQYHSQIKAENRYEISLSLSILQTLLTNCIEYLNYQKSVIDLKNPIYQSPIETNVWGFNMNDIQFSTFDEPETNVESVLRHLRNSLSHPTSMKVISNKYITTGYTTKGKTENIESIIFVNSPDLSNKGDAKCKSNLVEAERAINDKKNKFPNGVTIRTIIKNGRRIYAYERDGNPFYRCFIMKITPSGLLTLTYALSEYLSQSIKNKNWDGETYLINNIAA